MQVRRMLGLLQQASLPSLLSGVRERVRVEPVRDAPAPRAPGGGMGGRMREVEREGPGGAGLVLLPTRGFVDGARGRLMGGVLLLEESLQSVLGAGRQLSGLIAQ